jgi:hypothetical protein
MHQAAEQCSATQSVRHKSGGKYAEFHSVALASAMAVAATAGPAMAGPDYQLLTTIAVPSDAANL